MNDLLAYLADLQGDIEESQAYQLGLRGLTIDLEWAGMFMEDDWESLYWLGLEDGGHLDELFYGTC